MSGYGGLFELVLVLAFVLGWGFLEWRMTLLERRKVDRAAADKARMDEAIMDELEKTTNGGAKNMER